MEVLYPLHGVWSGEEYHVCCALLGNTGHLLFVINHNVATYVKLCWGILKSIISVFEIKL